MPDVDVVFMIEHIDRELDVATCLMQRLRERFGLSVLARGYYHDYDSNLALNPRVVVTPFLYGADHLQPVEYSRRWPDACFVNLGWEQVLNKLDVGMKIPRDDVSRKRAFHICWTGKHRDFLASHGVSAEHLLLTGNPVMKLYQRPYSGYFKSRDELASLYGLDSARKWVLFPESYQFAFFSDEHLENLVRDQNADMQLLRAAKDYSVRSLRLLLRWVNELAGTGAIVVMRPRPSTEAGQMHEFMQGAIGAPRPHLRIIKAESVREWILAADHVISSHSTALIEAAVAGKPIHRFSPEPYPEAIALEWHQLVPLLDDRASLQAAIDGAASPSTGAPLAAWAEAQFFAAGDPFEAIAGAIDRVEREWYGRQPAVAGRFSDAAVLWDGRAGARRDDMFDAAAADRRLARWQDVLGARPA